MSVGRPARRDGKGLSTTAMARDPVLVKPKGLKQLNRVPPGERLAVLAEGAQLIAASIDVLMTDMTSIEQAGRHQSAAVLRSFAEEEAAKILIMLDLARSGWKDHAVLNTAAKSFYDHLARGLYVRAYDGSPADLAEVRRMVDLWRRRFYLDGPNDVDWIFGNEVFAEREERLYVDLVEGEDGGFRWTGPAARAAIFEGPQGIRFPVSRAVRLAGAMHRIGLLTERGLSATRTTWDGITHTDKTHWQEVRALNVAVLKQLLDGTATEGLANDVRFVCEHWIFPLTTLDLTLSDVAIEDLGRKRDEWLARQVGAPGW